MASLRPLFCLAAALPLFVACGGDDGGTVIPEGTHTQYVSAKAFVPTNNNQAREFGLDLNKDKTVVVVEHELLLAPRWEPPPLWLRAVPSGTVSPTMSRNHN